MTDLTNFVTKVRTSGNQCNTLEITIPKNICEFEGIEEGDFIKIWIKRVVKEESIN